MSHSLFTEKSLSPKVELIETELGSSLAKREELAVCIRKNARTRKNESYINNDLK
jgi:hypothetical protein